MRMLKIRNAILLIGSALLLGGTLLCTVADRAGIAFPELDGRQRKAFESRRS